MRFLFLYMWIVEDTAHIYFRGSFGYLLVTYMQKFGVSDKFLNCSNAALSHNFAKLLGNKHHKVYYIFRFAFESLSQLRVLSCNTYRTGIKIAYAHHNTAHCYKRSCGKAEFFCSKHAGDCDVTTAHKLSVSFYYNP